MKRKIVLIEICWVHLSYEYEKEAEEDDISPPLLCLMLTPQLGNYPTPQSVIWIYNSHLSLLCDTLNLPLYNLHLGCVIFKVGQVNNLSPHCNKVYLSLLEDKVRIALRVDSV